MFPYLLILFTVVPAIELLIIIDVGSHIGSLNTLLFIVFTGILGASLARMQGFIVLTKIQNTVNQGLMPSEELLDGLLILVGGVLLLTPGFLTDGIGFSLLIPLTRLLIKQWIKKRFSHIITQGQTVNFTNSHKPNNGYDDIDV